MAVDHLIIAVAGTVAVALYGVGFVQIKRAFPDRANWLIAQILLTAVGATSVAGFPGLWPGHVDGGTRLRGPGWLRRG